MGKNSCCGTEYKRFSSRRELLREKMADEEKYLIAMEQYLAQPPSKLKRAGSKYPSREELHGR